MDLLRLLLVDDHEVVRLGLISLLEVIPWVEVVDEVGTAAEAIAAVESHRPDLVIMDIRLPGRSGIEACREITTRWPDTRVIMLTSYADDDLILSALEANASGYVLKQVGNQALIDALESVRRGEAMLDPAVTKNAIEKFRQDERVQHGTIFKELTDREMRVLTRIAEGQASAQIAQELSISEQTVNNDIGAILVKLDLPNRFSAAIIAYRHNIKYYMPEDGHAS
jgi:DNA-binding NarL/FixJ family response regulator